MLSFKLLSSIAAFVSALLAEQVTAQNFCIHGINYNPRIGPDWAPLDQRCKGAPAIEADMQTLAQVARSVRLYGLGDCDTTSTVVPAAINAGLTVSLGLWVSGVDGVFESEFSLLQTFIQQNSGLFSSGKIVDIHVGSEAIYRKDVTAAKNIDDMQRVKALLSAYNLPSVPVTIAEIGDVYLAHPELTAAVDFIQANGFPFWEKVDVANAVPYFESRMAPLYQQATVLGKKVVIGETGWASNGTSPRASEASPTNAARYFSDFTQMAKGKGLEFYYFEGFDELWKLLTTSDTVEGYFGLFHNDGTLKTEIAALSLGDGCAAGTSATSSTSGSGKTEEASAPGSSSTSGSTGTTTPKPEECHAKRV